MNCDECGNLNSEFRCSDCEQSLCSACNDQFHASGRRKLHVRRPLCSSCSQWAFYQCHPCSLPVCETCCKLHPQCVLSPLGNTVCVYWDMISMGPLNPALLEDVQQGLGPVVSCKTYSEAAVNSAESVPSDLLLLDIASATSFTHIVVISESPPLESLTQLLRVNSNRQVYTFSSHSPLQRVTRPELVKFLKSKSEEGHLLYGIEELRNSQECSHTNINSLIEEAVLTKQVLVQQRELPQGLEAYYCSLLVSQLDEASLRWVLLSLKNDEMLPTEKSIKSRIKEAFGIKTVDLQHFLLAHPSSFRKEEWVDQAGRPGTTIYPRGVSWKAYDQQSKHGDPYRRMSSPEWHSLLQFLKEYFEGSDQWPVRSPDEKPRTIPGGKYGCTLFVKISGSPLLQGLSLGKISYLVQLALNEGQIKYSRNYIVWSSDFAKAPTKGLLCRQSYLKEVLLEMLTESSQGISLAQLPICLKDKLGEIFDVSKFGYTKLKDLLEAMPEVVVEPRNQHLYAVLMYRSQIGKILAVVNQVLKPEGMKLSELESVVYCSFGHTIDWTLHRVDTFQEFLVEFGKKYVQVKDKLVLPQHQRVPFQVKNAENKRLQRQSTEGS